MIRAAYIPLVFTVLLTIAAPAFAQDEPANAPATAVQEAVRRQARTVELRQTLIEVGRAEQRKDLAGAFKFYQTAYKLTQEIGSGIDAETKATVAGVSRVSYAIAQEAQSRGDYKAAATSIQSALRVDPKNEALLALKKNNEAWLAAQAGKIPSQETKDRVVGVVASKVKNATAVQDGKLLYELGKWDEAEAKFREVLNDEPDNQAAVYYIKLVQDARYAASDSQRDLTARKRLVEVEDIWQPAVKRELLPTPNPYVRSKEIHTGDGRQAIVSKLDRIRLSEVKYDGLELGEVIRNLSELTRKSDPDKAGINFMIISDAGGGGGGGAAPGAVDPTTGLPVAAAPSEGVDISTVRVKINPPLNNLRLADVLDAIVKTAEKPIKYSIEDYAVVFSTRAQEATPLFTRTFKVDPNTFMQGLESVESLSFGDISSGSSSGGGGGGGRGGRGGGNRGGGGGGGGQNGGSESGATIARVSVAGGGGGRNGGGRNGGGGAGGSASGAGGGGGISFVTRTDSIETKQAMVRDFFTAAGVNFAPTSGKSLFFNDRKGIILVRATLQDLDIIESAIQTLNVTPPQVNIQAKIAEVTQDDRNALGFNWYLGNTLMGNGNLGVQGGTAPTFAGAPTTANPSGIFPNPLLSQQLTDQLITGGLRNGLNAPVIGTLSGILTDPQFRLVVNALEQRDGVDLVSAPSVTTLSGRQTHIEVTDILSIVTGIDANQTGSGGGGNNTDGGNNNNGGNGAVGSTIQPTVEMLPFGPVLDVIPSVSADEYSIQMTIIPTITEFVGYDTSTFSVQAQGSTGNALVQEVPLPHLRTRQVTTCAVVWDGQTVVLGGLITEEVIKTKDKVPVIGDLPMFGRLFRSESAKKMKKNLLIFVTPTIIDPAGNRVHSDEEMPFAQSSIPPQRPVAAQP